jgi:hypothetical protein
MEVTKIKAWNKIQYAKEKEKMRNIFFSDPAFREFIARMRALRTGNS